MTVNEDVLRAYSETLSAVERLARFDRDFALEVTGSERRAILASRRAYDLLFGYREVLAREGILESLREPLSELLEAHADVVGDLQGHLARLAEMVDSIRESTKAVHERLT